MSEKKKLWAYALWCVSGIVGGHRFYLRRFITGAMYPTLIILSFSMSSSSGPIVFLLVLGWAVVDLALIPSMVRSCNASMLINPFVTGIQENEIPAKPLSLDGLKLSLADHNRAVADLIGSRRENSLPPPEFRLSSIRSTVSNQARIPKQAWDKEQYDIEYVDADGVISARTIDVLSVRAEPNATYIQGWCHTRCAERTFRADRIMSARRAGEAYSISDAEQHFYSLVPEVDKPDPDHDAVMSRVAPGLGVLVWIAKADREVTTDEESILFEFIEERNGLAGAKFAEIPWNKTKAAAWIDIAKPTFNTSMGTLGKISKTGRDYAMIKAYAARLAEEGGEAARKRMKKLFK